MKKIIFIIMILLLTGCNNKKIKDNIEIKSKFNDSIFNLKVKCYDVEEQNNSVVFSSNESINIIADNNDTVYKISSNSITFYNDGSYYFLEKRDNKTYTLSSDYATINVTINEEMYDIPFSRELAKYILTSGNITSFNISLKDDIISYYDKIDFQKEINDERIILKNIKNNFNDDEVDVCIVFSSDIKILVEEK